MDRVDQVSYNERLFAGGLRRRLHLARFMWLRHTLQALKAPANSVLELGCYDGKLLEHLPQTPARYLGLDANWEGGLDLAAKRWADQSEFEFRFCAQPQDMALEDEVFDLVIAMETLEHVPPTMLDDYLANMARATSSYFLVTVPNEIGVVFAAKYLTKRALGGDYGSYTAAEFYYAVMGQTEKVSRVEHKGFNYRTLCRQIAEHFDILECSGHPLGVLPAWLNFGIGILATPKRSPAA